MNEDQRSICPFCSMGCSLLLRSDAGSPYVGSAQAPALGYDEEGRVNRGSLCGKGNMALELLTNPHRIESPRLRTGDGEHVRAGWDEAMGELVRRLRDVVDRHGPSAVGLLAGPTLTNEEAAQAAALARALGTPHLDLCQPEDHVVLNGLAHCGAAPEYAEEITDISRSSAILVVGDLFTLAPCIAKPVLHARYDNRQNVVGTLGFWKSRTYLFGKPVLRCLAGREAAALTLLLNYVLHSDLPTAPAWAPEARAFLADLDLEVVEKLAGMRHADLDWFATSFMKAEHSAVLFGCGFAETERLDLVAGLSAMLAEAVGSRFVAMVSGANSYGVRHTLSAEAFPRTGGMRSAEMLAAAGTGEIRALVALGCDPVGAFPGGAFAEAAEKLELLATTAPLRTPTAEAADVVLPAGTWGEKAGTTLNAFGHENKLDETMRPPGTARTDARILADLLEAVASHADAEPAAGEAPPARPAPGDAAEAFFAELSLYLRLEGREDGAREMGTHWLFPESSPSQSGDGSLTRLLSWPEYESAGPVVALSPDHAAALGVVAGDPVRVRTRDAEARLAVRIEQRLVDDVVLVAPHYPETRRLTGWRLDGVLRDLDLRPERATVEALREEER